MTTYLNGEVCAKIKRKDICAGDRFSINDAAMCVPFFCLVAFARSPVVVSVFTSGRSWPSIFSLRSFQVVIGASHPSQSCLRSLTCYSERSGPLNFLLCSTIVYLFGDGSLGICFRLPSLRSWARKLQFELCASTPNAKPRNRYFHWHLYRHWHWHWS